jgi:hypothetical protein
VDHGADRKPAIEEQAGHGSPNTPELTGRTSDEYRSVIGHATSLLPPNAPSSGVSLSVREGHDRCNGGLNSF